MDWQHRMTAALDYLEAQLRGEIDVDEAARRAVCSTFHFYRMFEVILGMTPGEYVRRRRLSCAALDLTSGPEKVIDLAVKYGYDSPDAFTRAFKREFQCLPTEARLPGARLHSFPPLTFTLVLHGDRPLEYRLEEEPAFALTGVGIGVNCNDGSNFREIPLFWDRVMRAQTFGQLVSKARPGVIGVCGVCHHHTPDGGLSYTIAIETPDQRDGLPPATRDVAVPASLWAKFTSRGPISQAFQPTVRRVFAEWMPSSGREHAGTPELEIYPPGATEGSDYVSEYWVPLKPVAAGWPQSRYRVDGT